MLTNRIGAACALAVAVTLGGACTYGHEETQTTTYKPLVFPGEARLGASAFMVIDSNQVQIGDHLERYDLHRDRVRIFVEGNLGEVEASVRSVFAVGSGAATDDAEARRNAWVMVALFDLPSGVQASEAFSAPYPQHARVHLEVDDLPVPDFEGSIWVVGDGGEPTEIETELNAQPLLDLLEDALEPKTMVRLRARGDAGEGFQPTWNIGGISAEIEFDPTCLENPRAFAGSEAIKAGVTVGPAVPSIAHPGRHVAQIVVSHPQGFQLPIGSSVDATRRGSGPILDITFDRTAASGCNDTLHQKFWIHSLKVRDLDGSLRVSRPRASEVNFDGSEFFHFHYVDPDEAS